MAWVYKKVIKTKKNTHARKSTVLALRGYLSLTAPPPITPTYLLRPDSPRLERQRGRVGKSIIFNGDTASLPFNPTVLRALAPLCPKRPVSGKRDRSSVAAIWAILFFRIETIDKNRLLNQNPFHAFTNTTYFFFT